MIDTKNNDKWIITYASYDKDRNDPKANSTKLKTCTFYDLKCENGNKKCRGYLNTSGYRLNTKTHEILNCNEDIVYKHWNNITYEDVDYKLWMARDDILVKEDPIIVLKFISSWLMNNYPNNFCDSELSRHMQGFHFYFKWECEPTLYNWAYYKQVGHAMVYAAFCAWGWKDIIEYKAGKSKVFDDCTNSFWQTVYPTKINWIHNFRCNGKISDYSCLKINNIVLEKIKAKKNKVKREKIIKNIVGDVNYDNDKYLFILDSVNEVNDVQYINHYDRWSLFDSLSLLFEDDNELRKNWIKCAKIIPNQNGHTTQFYIDEPYKNAEDYTWFEIMKDKKSKGEFMYCNIDLLHLFGYDVLVKHKYEGADSIMTKLFDDYDFYKNKEGDKKSPSTINKLINIL